MGKAKTINRHNLLIGIGFVAALCLASCGSGPSEDAVLIQPTAQPAPPPVIVRQPKSVASNDADACGAKDLAYLVGKHRTEIPVPLRPEKRRVLCTNCAATMDFVPDRQNIVFDTQSGIIKSVTCG